MKNLISIIVPIYNAQAYLEETIMSVLNQTYKNFELILVNHASTDNSDKIIKKYKEKDSRIRLITLDINKGGPAYPRNEGLKIANGEYIAFLDADDVWLENKLEKQLEFMLNNDVDIVHTLAYQIDENSNIVGEYNNQTVYKILSLVLSEEKIIFYINYINTNSVFMKKDQKIFFDEDPNFIAIEDWKMWIECILENKRVVLLHDKLIKYRVHNASASNRDTDIGYRKSLYLLSLLFLKYKLPLHHYIFSSGLNIIRIIIKKIKG
jgi:teichuronic acid biosynthesis glycosyltransferase TuaG